MSPTTSHPDVVWTEQGPMLAVSQRPPDRVLLIVWDNPDNPATYPMTVDFTGAEHEHLAVAIDTRHEVEEDHSTSPFVVTRQTGRSRHVATVTAAGGTAVFGRETRLEVALEDGTIDLSHGKNVVWRLTPAEARVLARDLLLLTGVSTPVNTASTPVTLDSTDQGGA